VKRYRVGLLVLGLAASVAPCRAQNVTDYTAIHEPLLFLLREPAVQRDLALTHDQRAKLTAMNQQYDGELLSTRNIPPDRAQPRVAKVMSASRDSIAVLLDDQQRTRLRQLVYRVHGISFVLHPDASAPLNLTAEQQEQITSTIRGTGEKIRELQQQLQDGQASAHEVNELAKQTRQDEQLQVLELLTDQQRKTLLSLIGPYFDLAGLGRVTFKAPEFSTTGTWINSPPLQLADLQGQVVVVHFWAFGCINCIHNYPWYRQWQEKYADQGVTIVGVHTPETEREREIERVREKAEEETLQFPIVVDNDHAIWDAWGNSMWPSVYLIDRYGRLRYWWYGELNWQDAGGQTIMAQRIDELVAEQGTRPSQRD
jgi:peroxiredoxin